MQTQNVNRAYETIIATLRATRKKWRWLIFTEGVLLSISILSLVMMVALLGFQMPLPRWIRPTIVLCAIGVGIYTLTRTLLLPLFRKLTDAQVAVRLEHDNARKNRMLSAVQLKDTLTNNRFGYATDFIEQLIVKAEGDIQHIQLKQVFQREFQKIKRNAGLAVAALSLSILAVFWLPAAFTNLVQTFQGLPQTPQEMLNVQIDDIQPGNVEIERGTDVEITANVRGHLGAPVALYYQVGELDEKVSTTEWQVLSMHQRPAEILYQGMIKNVNRPLQYFIQVKDAASETYQITVHHEPIVKQFQLQLNAPAYTKLPPQTLAANIGDIQTLFGTEVVFTGTSNQTLAEAYIDFDESPDVSLQVTNTDDRGATLRGTFLSQRSENYHIRLLAQDGSTTNRAPIQWTVQVLKDRAPTVDIVEPSRDTVLDDTMLVPLKVEADDDYGIQKLQLVYRVEKEGQESVKLPLKIWNPTQHAVFLTYTWDVEPVGLFPGETLAYYVQAFDSDNVSGPNIGTSQTYTLRFPSLSELYDTIAEEQQLEQQGFESLFDEQESATGLVDTLLNKIRKSHELTFKDENLMQQVMDTQKRIEERATQLLEEMKQTAAEMENNELFDQKTLQKYQELQALMEEALSEEHKELLRKLSEALAKQEFTAQEKALMEANLNQEQFLQQLERAKSLYEQLLLQQELEAAVKQAEALAEQQKQLMTTLEEIEIMRLNEEGVATLDKDFGQTDEGLREGNDEKNTPAEHADTGNADKSTSSETANDLAQKEDRIGAEVEHLQEKLEKLGTDMHKLAENQENPPPQIEKLADEMIRLNQFASEHKLAETLQTTSERLRQAQTQQALESGREAEQTLSELAQGLDNALEFMEGANADETQTAMRQAVSSALQLSHLHEKVINQTDALLAVGDSAYIPSEIQRMQQLAADELSTAAGVSQLATQLWELGMRQMEVPPEIVWQLNASNDALSRAARALEDRQPQLALPIQRTALAELNQAIFQLLNAMGQMNQQMGASGLENMLEQLQQLAQNQEQLNQMTQQLNQQMRQQGQTPGLQELLRQLAGQQQLLREATERLAEMAEKMAEMLGSLEQVADEMTEVEQRLQQGTLDEPVIEKQQQILTRMLDSLKSLQKRDVGKRRKAEVAKDPAASAQEVPPLHPQLLEIVRKLENAPSAAEVESLPFQYREQLRLYFRALSRKTQ